MEKELAGLQQTNQYLTGQIGRLNGKISYLSLKNHELRDKLDNHRSLFVHTQLEIEKMQALASLDIEPIKKLESDSTTLDDSNVDSTMACWISKRDMRRENVLIQTRRHYSLELPKRAHKGAM